MKAKNTKVKAFGLEATETQLVFIIMVNMEAAAKHNYGSVFREPLETILDTFKYDYKHDATSLKTVLDLLVAADRHGKMCNAPAPTELQVNAVLLTLHGLLQDDLRINNKAPSEYETVYAATSGNGSNISIETYGERRYHQNKEQQKKEKKKKEKKKKRLLSRGRSRRNTNADDEVKNCPHCKKFERRKPHTHITHDKCM